MLGAFVGAAMVYSVYAELFSAYDNGELLVTGPNATAGVFATYPQVCTGHRAHCESVLWCISLFVLCRREQQSGKTIAAHLHGGFLLHL